MPDFEARFVSGTATIATKTWTDITPSPSGAVRGRRNPKPGLPETFLLATGAVNSTIEIQAVPMGNRGRHDAVSGPTLRDLQQNWIPHALIGSIVENLTDGSLGTITDNSMTTVTAVLAGGTDNDWDLKDWYLIRMADAALDGRLFFIDCTEFPGSHPPMASAAGWSAESTVKLPVSGHYTFTLTRQAGGGLIMHIDAEIT